DYLPEDSLVIIDEMSRVQEVAHSLDTEEAELYESLLEQRQIAPGMTFSYDFEDVWAKKHYQTIYMSLFMRHIKGKQPQNIVNVSTRAMQEFHGQMPLCEQDMERWREAEFIIVMMSIDEERAQTVQQILADYNMHIPIHREDTPPPPRLPVITTGNIGRGVDMPIYRLAIVTEQELFKKQQ